MADYFTQGCVAVPMTEVQCQDLANWLEEFHGEDSEDPHGMDLKYRDDGVCYVYSGIDFNPTILANAFQEVMLKHDLPGQIEIPYANTCSRPRPDGFGGGKIVVTKDEIVSWCDSKLVLGWSLVIVADGEIEVSFHTTKAEAQDAFMRDLYEHYQDCDLPDEYDVSVISEFIGSIGESLLWTIKEVA